MYIVPAITLPRALGSLILVIGRCRFGIKNFVLLCSATGLILGQGIFSLVALISATLVNIGDDLPLYTGLSNGMMGIFP